MNNLYQMFTQIAKPFYKNKQTIVDSKESTILSILSKYNAYYQDKVGIIVPSITKEPTKVIVSHIDLVHPFMKGFELGQTFQIVGEKRMYGALDNTLTNSFLILAIQELRDNGLCEDIEFLFTEGEESGLTGMSTYMENNYQEFIEKPFFINLDVTNDNQHSYASIEFDYPNIDICKQIFNYDNNIGFTNYRFTDDTSAILSYKGNGFSYCVPTWNYCHTYDSFCLVDALEPYYDGLLYLIKDLDTSKYVYNLQTLNNNNIQIL